MIKLYTRGARPDSKLLWHRWSRVVEMRRGAASARGEAGRAEATNRGGGVAGDDVDDDSGATRGPRRRGAQARSRVTADGRLSCLTSFQRRRAAGRAAPDCRAQHGAAAAISWQPAHTNAHAHERTPDEHTHAPAIADFWWLLEKRNVRPPDDPRAPLQLH